MEIATFAAGCFWCHEAIFKALKGVSNVTPGYSGGDSKSANYKDVSSGQTPHAEAFQLKYDPSIISYNDLLEVFWYVHDPTTLNRQGNDVGPQYRSVIFYHNDVQKKLAEESKSELDFSGELKDPIVTEIVEYKQFFEAKDYHKNYYENNKNAPYCQLVISPKMKKFRNKFKEKLA